MNYAQTAAVVDGLEQEERGSITVDGGRVVAEWDANRIDMRDLQAAAPFRFSLEVPGEVSSLELVGDSP